MSSPKQEELEIALRGIKLSIEFKEFLLSKDIHSRRVILSKCIEWFQLEYSHTPDERVNNCYLWFQEVYAINQNSQDEKRKDLIKSPELWDNLHLNLSKCLSFQKLVRFFF
jgi:hypothetical protein